MTVALAPPGRLMEPHLPAVTVAPQHNPVPTTLSAVPDLDVCSCHSQSSLQLPLSSPHLPFQPILCPTKARGSTVLVSQSPAQNPSMAPLCPRLRSELLSLASLPSRSGSYPLPPALPHFPSCMLDSGSLFSQTHVIHFYFWLFSRAAPDTQNVSPSSAHVQPHQPSRASLNLSSSHFLDFPWPSAPF